MRPTLLVNGRIYSRQNNSWQSKENVFFSNGKINSFPTNFEADSLPEQTQTFDLDGRTIIPALWEGHGHLEMMAKKMSFLDLEGCTTYLSALERIADFIETSDEEWIIGYGWNHSTWGINPHKKDLDTIESKRPVCLYRADIHALWVNSAAEKKCGVSEFVLEPPGGLIHRDHENRSTGVYVDLAMHLISTHIPEDSDSKRLSMLEKAEKLLLSHGILHFTDMRVGKSEHNLYTKFFADPRSINLIGYWHGLDYDWDFEKMQPTIINKNYEIAGVKLFTDGAFGSYGAYLREPYSDNPETRGILLLPELQIHEIIKLACFHEIPLAVHAIGDAALGICLEGWEITRHLARNGHRLEHVQLATESDISRIENLGIMASIQPIHAHDDKTMALSRIGADRLKNAYRIRSITQRTICGGGSDTPVADVNPWLGMAASMQRPFDDLPIWAGGTDHENIAFEDALTMYTINAALNAGKDEYFSSLNEGSDVNFIVLEHDPFEMNPAELKKVNPLQVWKEGIQVYSQEHRIE